jgi:DNA processing protein
VSPGAAAARVVAPCAAEWPARLGELGPEPPPTRLFAIGRRLDPTVPAVAVVGTRRPTGAGLDAAYDLAAGLAEAGWTVISGLAVGIDAIAHRAALESGGHTLAVLGCGLDVDYPARNRALKRRLATEGTIVTEYAPSTPPARHHFPLRNRIIAGLALGVVVVEGSVRSGALVTARLALDANRSVFAVPGSRRNPMAEGPNELIRTARAALVTEVGHVFEDLASGLVWARGAHAAPAVSCTPAESDIARALDDAPLALDHVAGRAGVAPGRAAVLLSQLEVKGVVVKTHAGYALSSARSLRA